MALLECPRGIQGKPSNPNYIQTTSIGFSPSKAIHPNTNYWFFPKSCLSPSLSHFSKHYIPCHACPKPCSYVWALSYSHYTPYTINQSPVDFNFKIYLTTDYFSSLQRLQPSPYLASLLMLTTLRAS